LMHEIGVSHLLSAIACRQQGEYVVSGSGGASSSTGDGGDTIKCQRG
jgi:hypothetical protein